MFQQLPLLLPFLAMAVGLTVTDQTGYHVLLYVVGAALICLVLSAMIRQRTPFVLCTFQFFLTLGLSALTPWKTPAVPVCSIGSITPSIPVTLQGVVRSRTVVSPAGTSMVVRMEQLLRAGQPEAVCGDLILYVTTGDVSLCVVTGSAS
jgi:hypothetical protein